MSRYHAQLAWVDGEVRRDVLLGCAGERLTEVRADVAAPPDAERLTGLVLPGIANAHSHAFHRALRARTHQGAGDFWEWRRRMYDVAAVLDPDLYRQLATAAYAEMAQAGVTAVGEFHYLHHDPAGRPYDEANVMGEALATAAADAGIRLTLLDTCYLRGGFDQDLDGAQRRFADADADAWAARAAAMAGHAMLRRGAAIHSVRTVPEHAMPTVVGWARERAAPLHVHVSEQPAENTACLSATGRTPTGLLADVGALGPQATAVHATHVTGADIASLGSTGTAVCLCPTTERDLADGVGPARLLVDAGSPLCLGTDSHAVVDLFEEARAVELDERLATLERGHHGPSSLLEAMTTVGQAQLGWDVGLRPGALADFVAVDLASTRTAGATTHTAVAHAVFAACACDVTDVVVAGRAAVRDRRHTRVDTPTSLARALAAVDSALP